MHRAGTASLARLIKILCSASCLLEADLIDPRGEKIFPSLKVVSACFLSDSKDEVNPLQALAGRVGVVFVLVCLLCGFCVFVLFAGAGYTRDGSSTSLEQAN